MPATEAKLIFQFKFDSTQLRLNNLGQPSALPAGNAGQSPIFNSMCAHYIEMTPTMFTPLGSGAVLYKAPETTAGGSNAIDFEAGLDNLVTKYRLLNSAEVVIRDEENQRSIFLPLLQKSGGLL